MNADLHSQPQDQTQPPPVRRFFPAKCVLDLKTLKDKSPSEVVYKINESMARFKFFLRSEQEQHDSDEFIFDLTCTLATACGAPPNKDTNEILAALKGSIFLISKIPRLLDRLQVSTVLNEQESQRRLIQSLMKVFTRYLRHLPSSYADLPYTQLKQALDQSSIDETNDLQRELEAFKQTRDDIITAERQKHGKRYVNKTGQKPPNDFRDIPICPTNKEITSHERPFLRQNILKGRYEDAEHYLDVQFRLLREDFLEPLREGIHEIIHNVPRKQRNQLMKYYPGARIVDKKFTPSGIIYQVQFDVSRFDTKRWANSKRLLFGSFLCLSNNNFETMLFATVCKRDSDELAKGRIEIRFIEDQDVFGVENRKCEYQMVESPAYYEAYRHVLKGLKELDETTMPFKKYLVECREDVDSPEYLRREDWQEPVCYDLRLALGVPDAKNASKVPILQLGAWPSVEILPLNSSQLDALKTAITTEFSVIQGPPGTGKTYVGAKIVRCLLENRAAWDPDEVSPMLMVCYTNHALDQFLEKVLEFLPREQIIRVGGRCKSPQLQRCNLKLFTDEYRMHERRREIRNMINKKVWEIRNWKKLLSKGDKELLEFDDLENLLDSKHSEQLYSVIFPPNTENDCRTPDNAFKLWLCGNKQMDSFNRPTVAQTEETEEQMRTNQGGSILLDNDVGEDDKIFYDATLLAAPHDNDEGNGSNPPVPTSQEELKEGSFYCNGQNGFLAQQSSQPFGFQASSPVEHVRVSQTLKLKDIEEIQDSEWIKDPLGWKNDSIGGNSKIPQAFEETIEVEKEADLIQDQRFIHGDEDFLSFMSTQSDDLGCQEHNQEDKEDQEEGWETVSYGKKRKKFAWQQTTDKKSKDAMGSTHIPRENITTQKESSRRNENKKIKITADINSLKLDLEKIVAMPTDEAMSVDNIWLLSSWDRRRLYLFWIESYRERFRAEIQRGEQEYDQLCQEQEAVKFEEEEEVIRRATVVGMTTSGAARYHSTLQSVAPRVVVIEEAAEVMEAHIITSLSHDTKHTILIGDHKQLRPKATVYELAKKYNLAISLFERMVMNSMDCKRLSIQHRMRPEIAALTKRIYDHDIVDHETVCEFKDISGLNHNLFFIDHCEPEVHIDGMQSYSNPHEADFLVALCKYLLLQGYRGSQITVLTMYTGQLLHLQEKMPRKTFWGVRVCAVDNFQGEENDIILLSLVRSNSEQRIGFLNESNRICVALSRARQGFYCIGNFKLLKSQNKLWQEICNDLETKNAIGETLQLVCKKHNKVTIVRTSREFDITFGGCKMPCGERLVCGHACEKPCHVSADFHEKGHCRKPCLMKCCLNDHQCQHRCHYPSNCAPCRQDMLKTVPQCGHEQPIPCSVDPEMFSCTLKCEKLLKCGHNCQEACGELCTRQCNVPCKKTLPCGHEKTMPCFNDPEDYKGCNNKCTKRLECGHPCSRTCKQRCECNTKIQVDLPCGHQKQVLCRMKDRPPQCVERCRRALNCGHDCPGLCHEECAAKKCKSIVLKFLPCGHQQPVTCQLDPKKAFCYAPCQRQLDCGHRCTSVCGRVCDDVRCEELCQKKCERGHACQRRCHFGSSCNDCMEVVNMTIPTCGHIIKMPCYVDPYSLRCKEPCQRVRICGHHCQSICSTKCEAQACKALVKTTFQCGHEATIPCHKDPKKYKCEEIVEVCLPCGHNKSLACHVAQANLQKVLCNVKVEKELPCKHKLTLPCHKNPKECKCKKKVDVQLLCGHTTSVICSNMGAELQNVSCKVKLKRRLPCDHEITIPCYKNQLEHVCEEEAEITLSCGHKKLTTCSKARHGQNGEICDAKVTRRLHCGHERTMLCSENPEEHVCEEAAEITLSCGHRKLTSCSKATHGLYDEICDTKVTRRLDCGHERKMLCSEKPVEVFCDAPCEQRLPCEHLCAKKCGDDCASFKCAVRVQKLLACGFHEINCGCSDDVSQVICQNECKRTLSCGHKCPGKCSDDCRQFQCQKMIVKQLNCAGRHSLRMSCSDDPNTAVCQERCNNKLDCDHPCPGSCSQPCGSLKCTRKVEKTFPCGHIAVLKCFQSETATCKERCGRQKTPCKHICKGVCGEDCSKYPCDVKVAKNLSCGHKIKMLCSRPAEEVQCPFACGKKLPCGHPCSGACDDCKQSGSHELCEHPCGRLLVCSHRCKATCSEPCPPCDRKCERRCPHGQCNKRCAQPCDPCRRPCTWNCPHYQCKNLCGEECDRPRCDAPCPKKLPCRHPCIGLCGENCPTLCAICNGKKLSSILADGRENKTEPTRCLQLLDCGHIIKVEEMDRWMLQELVGDDQPRRCPKCSTSITFSYRYGNIIKRALRNIENVKKTVQEIVYEESASASRLLPQGLPLPSDVTKLKFPPMVLRVVQSHLNDRNWLDLPRARGRIALFIFTLKNHLLILQQAQRTYKVLQEALTDLRGNSQQQVELKELCNDTKDAIEQIKVYLEEPQLDLKTLSQVYEQTRKIFLFSQVLEAQSKATIHQIPFSSNGTTRLRLACYRFRVFLKGNDNVLDLEWLRETVILLRTEMSLHLIPLEEAKDFENFPGYQRDVWKSCDQGHVYFKGWIVRGGEDIPVGSEGCSRCMADQ